MQQIITTVLKILSEEGIAAWRARVGEEEANRVSRIASTRGTQVHNILENYENYSQHTFKLFIFLDESKCKKKIRLQLQV